MKPIVNMSGQPWVDELIQYWETDPSFQNYCRYWDKADKKFRRYIKKGQTHYYHGIDGVIGLGRTRQEAFRDYQWKHNKRRRGW